MNYPKDFINQIIHADCFDILPLIPDNSIDLIVTDPPYNINNNLKWDKEINFKNIFHQLNRITKIIIITCKQPLTSFLIVNNINTFRYCLIWDKVNLYGNFLNANKMPLSRHEDIIIFSKYKIGNFTYNKQYRKGKSFISKCTYPKENGYGYSFNKVSNHITVNKGLHNPCSILKIKSDLKLEKGLHPTQKPVALFEYLIKTYSNKNNIALDCFSGSGTLAIACINADRKFICIEKEKEYFDISVKRLENYKLKENKHGQKFRII